MSVNYQTRSKREREFFDREALEGMEYWGWRTKTGEYRHFLRGELIKNLVPIKKGMRVLELGCGLGGLTRSLVKTGATLYMVDISPVSINYVRKNIKSTGTQYKIEDAHKMSFRNNSFDAVVGNAILHHLDLKRALSQIYRVLVPGGKIFFFEPNMLNPEIFIERKSPFFRKLSRSSPDETAYFRWDLKKRLEVQGFVNIDVLPYDFLYPAIPFFLVKPFEALSNFLEKVPILKEIAGSLVITGEKQ